MFYVKASDGVKIAVYDYNPQGSRTVVMVHGWPLSHEMYEYQVELLTRKGYRVVTLDLRGFGRSDTPAGPYCYDQMAADLFSVVRALGLRRFALVGFSMGGAIVLRYMRRYRGLGVERLILLAAAAPSWTQRPGFPYNLPLEYVDGLIREVKTDRPKLCWTFSHEQLFAGPQSEQAMDWFEDIALSASGVGTLGCLCALRDEDGRADLAAVHVPTVILHGAKDVVVDCDLARIQQEQIRGSRLITLENSGHGIVYDELELFNRCFLEAVRG